MQPPAYKDYQLLYDEYVQEHADDFANMEIVEDPELVENALHYFKEASFPLIYPAKSYAVAIIYATKIHELYDIPVKTTLNDPDLFLGHDRYFVPYELDPHTYDAILARLETIPNWMESGWAPQSVKYCLLECTEDGVNSVLSGE
jgi:hypothetical protein